MNYNEQIIEELKENINDEIRKESSKYKKWRSFVPNTVVLTLANKILTRLELGEERYKSSLFGFQGDPLEHLEEELLDAVFYVYMLRKKLEYEKRQTVHNNLPIIITHLRIDGIPICGVKEKTSTTIPNGIFRLIPCDACEEPK